MELTEEALIKNGFDTDHPERVFCKFKRHTKSPESMIIIEKEYKPQTNEITYNANCWICEGKGSAITRRTSISYIKTIEDLNNIIKLCNIDFQLAA